MKFAVLLKIVVINFVWPCLKKKNLNRTKNQTSLHLFNVQTYTKCPHQCTKYSTGAMSMSPGRSDCHYLRALQKLILMIRHRRHHPKRQQHTRLLSREDMVRHLFFNDYIKQTRKSTLLLDSLFTFQLFPFSACFFSAGFYSISLFFQNSALFSTNRFLLVFALQFLFLDVRPYESFVNAAQRIISIVFFFDCFQKECKFQRV